MIVPLIVGLLTGIVSGCGIGGGSLLVLYLTAVAGVDQYAAGGINLLYFLCCAPVALIGHIRHHRVAWRVVLWAVSGGVVTAVAASFLAAHIDTDWLRRGFGLVLLYVGVRELFAKK